MGTLVASPPDGLCWLWRRNTVIIRPVHGRTIGEGRCRGSLLGASAAMAASDDRGLQFAEVIGRVQIQPGLRDGIDPAVQSCPARNGDDGSDSGGDVGWKQCLDVRTGYAEVCADQTRIAVGGKAGGRAGQAIPGSLKDGL